MNEISYRRIFLTTAAAACAQVYTTTFADSATKIHNVSFEGCHFKIEDAFNGEITLTKRSKPVSANYDCPLYQKGPEKNPLWIQMWCRPPTQSSLSENAGVRLEGGVWGIAPASDRGSSEKELKDLKTTLVKLNGKNWAGAGRTQDQNISDEDMRVRTFAFCIPKNEIALCGFVESAAQLNNLKESAMPNIIKLLEGIEFVDDATTAAPAAADTH